MAVPELRSLAIICQGFLPGVRVEAGCGLIPRRRVHPAGTLVPAAGPLPGPSALLARIRCAAEWEPGRRLSCLLQPE